MDVMTQHMDKKHLCRDTHYFFDTHIKTWSPFRIDVSSLVFPEHWQRSQPHGFHQTFWNSVLFCLASTPCVCVCVCAFVCVFLYLFIFRCSGIFSISDLFSLGSSRCLISADTNKTGPQSPPWRSSRRTSGKDQCDPAVSEETNNCGRL